MWIRLLHESGSEVEEVRTQEDGKQEEVLGHSPAAAAGREGWPFANVPKLSRSIAATPAPLYTTSNSPGSCSRAVVEIVPPPVL